jgi:hypothetical protein
MQEWYIQKMKEAHEKGNHEDRRNYAKAANVDYVKEFYLKEKA